MCHCSSLASKELGLRQYSLKDMSTGFHAQTYAGRTPNLGCTPQPPRELKLLYPSSTCLDSGTHPEPNILRFRQCAWIHFLLFITIRTTSHLTCQTLHATIIAISHLIYQEPHATNTTTGHLDLLGTTCYHHNY